MNRSGQKRDGKPDRRKAEERRSGGDRRGSADSRSAEERRSADERRAGVDRRAASAAEEERRRLITYTLTGLALCLVPALSLLIVTMIDPVKPVRKRPTRIDDPSETMTVERLGVPSPGSDAGSAVEERVAGNARPRTASRPNRAPAATDVLRTGLMGVAPEIYSAIDLQIVSESGQSAEDLGSVHGIHITVRSAAWDELPSTARVDLIGRTFNYLRSKYPEVTQFVELKFDDGRPPLDLKDDDAD